MTTNCEKPKTPSLIRDFCLGFGSSRGCATTSRGRIHRFADQSNHRSASSDRGSKIGLSHLHRFGLRGSVTEIARAEARGSSRGRYDEMAQPHLPLRRLRVLLPRRPPRGAGQGDATCSTSKISAIHGGRLHRPRVSASLNLQLCCCTYGCRSASVQTGSISRSFLPSVEIKYKNSI